MISKKMISRVSLVTLISLSLTSSIKSFADDVSRSVIGIKSINNNSQTTYKTPSSFLEGLSNLLGAGADIKEIINYNEDKEITDGDSSLSYLVTNNIVSNDININYDRTDSLNPITTEGIKKYDYDSNTSIVNKNDFLMALSKSVFGVQTSRPIVFPTYASRYIKGDVTNTLTEYQPNNESGVFDYSKGDYSVYYSSNVYEQYFKTLVEKGVLDKADISNVELVKQLDNYSVNVDGKTQLPSWDPSLGVYMFNNPVVPNNITSIGESPLGNSFSVINSNVKGSIINEPINYFFDEELLKIDALRYIETALRLSEKDMTNTESEIINYKYGASYLSKLDSESKDTVMFLVAKGILNFENESEFENLFQTLDNQFFITIMYRVANPNARLDFTKIQLTDSDNYWLSKGFYKNDVKFYNGEAPLYEDEITEESNLSLEPKSYLFGFINIGKSPLADSSDKLFTIDRVFKDKRSYTYKGIALNKDTKKTDEITSVEVLPSGALHIKFAIKAKTDIKALAILDSNIVVKDGTKYYIGTVPAVSTVTTGTLKKTTTSYISKSSLLQTSEIHINVIEDKYLVNTDTGSKAILLQDNKIAIIGNEIIKTDANIVAGLNGEVYYNLELIVKLLSNSAISSVDPSSIYLTDSKDFKDEGKLATFYDRSNGSVVATSYIAEINTAPLTNQGSFSKMKFVDITNSATFSNFLIQDVSKDVGRKDPLYMVVEFQYLITQSLNQAPAVSSLLPKVKDGKLTIGDIYAGLYTRPADVLGDWWDSNITFNDRLLNYMMGTTDLKYFSSGYLVPKVTFLVTKGKLEDSDLNKFMTTTIGLTDSFVASQTKLDSSKNFIDNFFYHSGHALVSTGTKGLDKMKELRTLEVMLPNSKNKSNYLDYYDYAVSAGGRVFNNILARNDVTLRSASDNSYNMSTRTDNNNGTPIVSGSNYTIKNSKSAHSNLYAMYQSPSGITDFVSTKYVKLSYKKSGRGSGSNNLYDSSGYYKVDDYMKDIGKGIFGEPKSEGYIFYEISSINIGAPIPTGATDLKTGTYYYDDKFYKVTINSTGDSISKAVEIQESTLKDGDIVYMYPKFKVPTFGIVSNELNELEASINNPSLSLLNISNVGLSGQIIDRIVYDSMGYVTYDKLPKNAVVYIGDKEYLKSGELLQSHPILDVNNSNILMSTDVSIPANIANVVANSVGNIPLVNKSTAKINSLADVMTSVRIGVGLDSSTYPGITLVSKSSGFRVKMKDGSEQAYIKGQTRFDSYCIAFSLSNNVRFRAIDAEGTKFALVNVISGGVDGSITDMPYYSETLALTNSLDSGHDVTGAKYKPVDNINKYVDDFMSQFKAKLAGDIYDMIRYWLIVFFSWACVLNTIVAIFRRMSFNRLAEVLRYPSSGKVGFDIYRWFSLGFQTVDSELSLPRTMILCIVLMGITVAINYI